MDDDGLRAHLAQFHRELSAANDGDPRSAQLRGELLADIERLLGHSQGSPDERPPAAAVPADAASLPDRLERMAVQFEVAHPTLAASSRRLVDLLGKVGL